jgi:L-alanine-DL-glutamate epimerase-like enolase superfamily enzyme
MKIQFEAFQLALNYPFKISDYSRTSTPIVFVRISDGGFEGIGEASMPPYLGESIESASHFLSMLQFEEFTSIPEMLYKVDTIAPGNNAAKAAVDLALHDWYGKKNNIPLYKHFNSNPALMPPTSFTLGIDSIEVLREKIKDTDPFHRIKIKLGSENDKDIVENIRSITDKEILVDANRGWKTKEYAAEMIDWLATKNCILVEQPMPVDSYEDMLWLKSRSALPLFADESCKRIEDIENIKDGFHGINIKLMKSTGLLEASKMIQLARDRSLKVMIGCMSESSCGIMAAAALAPQCDYADLDSTWMVSNNPFKTPTLTDGKIVLSDVAGIGY